jgi:hypothetical protein
MFAADCLLILETHAIDVQSRVEPQRLPKGIAYRSID